MTPAGMLRTGAMADEFARLRRDLAALAATPRHLVVLGAAGGEGVTTVALHLALAMGGVRGDSEVVLVEGNLRTPSLARDLGLPPGPGLLDWDLTSPLPTRAVDGMPGTLVLTAGTATTRTPGGPSNEDRLIAALQRIRTDFAASIWDAPPVLRYSDGLEIAAHCDGALVVIEMDQTRADGLRYMRSALDRRHATLIGSVLNRSGRYWPRSPKRAAA